MSKSEELTEVQLFSSIDEYLINQICAILQEKDIPYIRRDDGSGAYMNVYMGSSIQEKRIYVNKKDYEKAIEVIEAIIPNGEEKILNQIEEENDNIEQYQLVRRLAGYFLLGIPLAIFMIVLIIAFTT